MEKYFIDYLSRDRCIRITGADPPEIFTTVDQGESFENSGAGVFLLLTPGVFPMGGTFGLTRVYYTRA
jgi:hypothetical protein